MESDWTEMPLEEAMDAIIDYRGKTPTKTTSGIPLITAKIVKNGRINPTQEYIAEADYDSWMQRGIPRKGDVVLTTEAPLGEVAQLDGSKIALAQRIITLRGKAGLLESDFLKYLLQSNDVRHQLDGRASGTTVSGIKQSELRQVLLSFPPIPEQKTIAHILGTLDDKIELNRRMNATLEGMAQALFKSWFVDFDPVIDNAIKAGNPIPDELTPRAEVRRQALTDGTANRQAAKPFPAAFQETESMGWIPEGWKVQRADEIADISIGKTPPRKESHWFSNERDGNVTWVSIKDMGSCGAFIGDSNEYLTPESVNKFNVKVIPEGSVLLSFKLTVGRVSITQHEMATNEAIAHLVNPKFGLMKEYVYSYLKTFDFSSLGSTSSIATAVNSKIIKAMPFLVPDAEVLESFEKVAGHWFDAISIRIVQTKNLTKLRDTLLPQLISGELSTEAFYRTDE